jgi:hypothetical protein
MFFERKFDIFQMFLTRREIPLEPFFRSNLEAAQMMRVSFHYQAACSISLMPILKEEVPHNRPFQQDAPSASIFSDFSLGTFPS